MFLSFLFRFVSVVSLLFCSLLTAEELSHYVLVSVAPHKFFVEKIAGDTVKVGLMVPAGASSHTYEPTPKQMLAASKADMWFCIGEGFETRAIRCLTSYRSMMKIVNLRNGVDMITADPHTGCCCCHANAQDLHIWLSARQAQIQATTIAQALSESYPKHAERYQKALEAFVVELQALDGEISEQLKPVTKRMMMVSHPAYAYFCRDYHFKQLSIEFEGKDPTPQQLTQLLQKARGEAVQKVFIQAQYPSKGARLLAKELGAQVVLLDPYAEDYMSAMRSIANELVNHE